MEIQEVKDFIIQIFNNTYCQEHEGDFFFFYGSEVKFPFATIVTKDNDYDNVSNLNRPGVFRLNVGVSKETFKTLFGHLESKAGLGGFLESGIDFTELNKIMPHPIYGNQYWISILNPGEETFQNNIATYLSEAYEKAVRNESKNK
jgi:hypothetical protein